MELSDQKKGGPYTKSEKRKRLDEVYKLHFEYGYSARKIADLLKVNRSTINRDIMDWYAEISTKWRHKEVAYFVINHIERMEIQRTKIRKQLDTAETFQEKMLLEKFILDIDMKIGNLQMKLVQSRTNIKQHAENEINNRYKLENSEKRVFSTDKFMNVSNNGFEKLKKIYMEDMKY